MPCLTPYVKENPNYGKGNIGYNFLKDCDSRYINIPCGYCPDCIAVKQMYWVQRIQMESLYNHLFFGTLTYDDKHLPVITIDEFDIRYACADDVVLTLKRLRKDYAFGVPFRYFFVSELGTKKGRPHFHILFLIKKGYNDTLNDCLNLENTISTKLREYWSVNIGTKFKPIYEPRFTYVSKIIRGKIYSNYDLHYVNPALTSNGTSDVAFYVLKYMLKYNDRTTKLQQALRLNLSPSEYEYVWNIVKPVRQCSLGFGLNLWDKVPDPRIIKYLRDCVEKTPNGSSYPYFYSPINGLSFPLCPYYRNNGQIYSLQQALRLYRNKVDNYNDKDLMQLQKKFKDYEKKTDFSYSYGASTLFDELR